MRLLTFLIATLSFLFLANCSSMKEVQPAESAKAEKSNYLKESGFYEIADEGDSAEDLRITDHESEFDEPSKIEEVFPNELPNSQSSTQTASNEEEEAETEVEVEAEAPSREPAAYTTKFKGGFYRFADNCAMKKSAAASAKNVGWIAPGKKLWVDPHNSQWLKVYKKSGTVYIRRNCIE